MGGDSWVESGILDNVKSLLDMSLSDDAVFVSMEVFNAAFVAEKISTAEKGDQAKSFKTIYRFVIY